MISLMYSQQIETENLFEPEGRIVLQGLIQNRADTRHLYNNSQFSTSIAQTYPSDYSRKLYLHPPPPLVVWVLLPTLPLIHPECTTLLSG